MGKAYFISDLHLGASYTTDDRGRERKVADFIDSLRGKADELYLVGDILDYWFEYRTVVPRGYVRFFGALAALADSGVKITWFIGNHDIWLFDYIRDEIGVDVVDGALVKDIKGKKFFITHGDGVGRLDLGFRFIRSVFRNRICQKLYSGIHPRWTIPFAHRWSSHSRTNEKAFGFDPATDSMIEFARETYREDPSINYFVFGHRHVVCQTAIAPDCEAVILGDWLTHFSYGVFDGKKFEMQDVIKTNDSQRAVFNKFLQK